MKIFHQFNRMRLARGFTPLLLLLAAMPAFAQPSQPIRCSVEYDIQSQWGWGFVADITVTNNGTAPIEGYALTWSFTEGGQFHSGWNASFDQTGSTITASNPVSAWNGTIAPNGGEINFGMLGQSSGATGPVFSLNGVACDDTNSPSGAFTFWPQSVSANEAVRFYGLASYDVENEIVSYEWDFGDGVTASGPNVTHAFSSTGNQTVTLTVTDSAGNTGTHEQTVPVPLGSGGPVDLGNITWEDGTLGGWYAGGASTLAVSTTEVFAGASALQWNISTAGAEFIDLKVDAPPSAPPGSRVILRVWVPADAPIDWVQPFVMPHSDDWSVVTWHGDWRAYGSMIPGAWNEFSMTIQPTVDPAHQQQIGVQLMTNGAGNFAVYVDSIDWEEGTLPPKSSFDYSPARPAPGETVTFTAAGSGDARLNASDRDGTIESYAWDFGDGQTGTGSNVTHTYAGPGKYAVTLTVTDNDGLKHSTTRVVWSGQTETAFAPPLDVVGTDIVDANGDVVVPRGVAMVDDRVWTRADFEYLKKEYKINFVRMVLITDRWYYVDAAAREAYLGRIDNMLDWTRELGIYVMFDGWHEGGQGNELEEWTAIQDAWHILAQRYGDRDHIIWEVFNEPHFTTWEEWAGMAETLIDIILSYNPVVKTFGVPGVVWAQELDVRARRIERDNVIYEVHPYPHVYEATWTPERWDAEFGYVALEGYGPVMNSEFSYPLFDQGDRSYGEAMLAYQQARGFGWLHWIYGDWSGPKPGDPNALRDDAWQLIWESLNGVWSPE
ncbi:MAG TPA: PKD domain-containing protein [Gammaproteobacteria bacterium]